MASMCLLTWPVWCTDYRLQSIYCILCTMLGMRTQKINNILMSLWSIWNEFFAVFCSLISGKHSINGFLRCFLKTIKKLGGSRIGKRSRFTSTEKINQESTSGGPVACVECLHLLIRNQNSSRIHSHINIGIAVESWGRLEVLFFFPVFLVNNFLLFLKN